MLKIGIPPPTPTGLLTVVNSALISMGKRTSPMLQIFKPLAYVLVSPIGCSAAKIDAGVSTFSLRKAKIKNKQETFHRRDKVSHNYSIIEITPFLISLFRPLLSCAAFLRKHPAAKKRARE